MEFLRFAFKFQNFISQRLISSYLKKNPKKFLCEQNRKCAGYTFDRSQFNCVLHSSSDKVLVHTRGKETGVKKTDYVLSLPSISLCLEENRQKRCKREPKCQHMDCVRYA